MPSSVLRSIVLRLSLGVKLWINWYTPRTVISLEPMWIETSDLDFKSAYAIIVTPLSLSMFLQRSRWIIFLFDWSKSRRTSAVFRLMFISRSDNRLFILVSFSLPWKRSNNSGEPPVATLRSFIFASKSLSISSRFSTGMISLSLCILMLAIDFCC